MLSLFKRYIALILIFIGIVFLWDTLFVYPLKIFVGVHALKSVTGLQQS